MSRYVYPLSPKATTGRTDQGKDFGGAGPIRAIGNALIVKTGAPGWPGGEKGVLYKLLDGPARGKYVYTYEGISPSVRAGQRVKAGQVIGSIIPGTTTGIEMGWATSTGEPISHAEYTEGKETVGGKAFAGFLERLKKGGGAGGPNPFERTLLEEGKTPAEAKKISEEQSHEEGFSSFHLPGEKFAEEHDPIPAIASGVDLTKAVVGALEDPESLLLNIGLLGGGAFLVYLGAAKVLGVRRPVAAPATALAKGAAL